MITAKNLVKKFEEQTVINDISLNICEGDFVGIVGESGSGKSTLLYLLCGLIAPTSGTVSINKKEITNMGDTALSEFRAGEIGFVFQFHNLVKGLTVMENMEIPLVLTRKNPLKYREKIKELLECVGLQGKEKCRIEDLSGGQQQRVAIARALVNDPAVIFADEPTGSLDSENTNTIVQLLGELNKNRKVTIVMVTHSEKTLVHCNKVIEICDGRKGTKCLLMA